MKRGLIFAGCGALLLAAIATMVSAQQGPAEGDPLELFAKMMPVFGHPRCINCHGGVALYDEEVAVMAAVKHGGGVVSSVNECAGCHGSSKAVRDAWRLADHQDLRFFGKDAKQMCDMQAEVVRKRGRASYLTHVRDDVLIAQAFEGRAGGARDTKPPDKPPMTKDDFLAAARAWLASGASCKSWDGTITQTETFASNYGFPIAGATASVRGSAKRVVTITRKNGMTTAEITMSGHQTQQLVKQDGSCTTTVILQNDWKNAASAGAKPAIVRFEIAPDGSYRIWFKGPREKTRTSDSDSTSSTCGSLPQPIPGDTDLDWDPWVFNIRCPLDPKTLNASLGEKIEGCGVFDPKVSPILKGNLTRVLVDRSDAADPQSWLMTSPASVGRADNGAQLPVTVFTEWNFVLVN